MMSPHEPVLRLLGLAARAGTIVAGTERVREAAREGTLRFAIVAGDASPNAEDKVVPLLVNGGIPYRRAYDRARLGGSVGRSSSSAIGVLDAGLAGRLQELLAAETMEAPGTGPDSRLK
jgi:ribosomal protein L7Ae-like RNA K-turn-binding protein